MLQKNDPEALLKAVIELWVRYSGIVSERFGMKPAAPPDSISLTDSSPGEPLGGHAEGTTLTLTDEVVAANVPLDAVIARACFTSALKSDDVCDECIDDFGTEFARQILSPDQRDAWVERWSRQVPPRALGTVLKRDPSLTFPPLYSLAGPKALDDMVREVKTMRKHGIALTLEDYLTFFQARVRQISVRLDKTELRIIDRLLKDPSISQSSLATELQLSEQWVSRKIPELQGKYVLRKFERVPFSRIGIRMFHLLGRLTDEETDAFQLLKDCPFLYSFRRVVSGYWHFLATLSVPDNIESMQSLERGCDMARGWGMETSLLEIASSGVSTCFDYYSVEKAEWYLPWALMSVQLKRIYEDGLASAAPRIDRPAAKTRSELDELDMKIVDCIRRGVTSVAEIRHALRVGQQRVADQLKALRDEGLIVTTWEAHNIGLVESEVLAVQDPKAGESISAWAQRLPRCIVSFDTSRRLVLLADLPQGGTYGFSTAVAVLPHCVDSGLLNYKVYGEWGLPVELWDSSRQRWLCPTEKTNAWLSTLR